MILDPVIPSRDDVTGCALYPGKHQRRQEALVLRIPCREFNIEGAREIFTSRCEGLAGDLKAARENVSALSILASRCIALAESGSECEPSSPEIPRALRLATQANAALAAAAQAGPDNPVRAPLGPDQPAEYHRPSGRSDMLAWTDGFLLALLCRDNAALDLLCGIPTEALRLARGVSYAAYLEPLADALRAFRQSRPDTDRLIALAVEAAQHGRHPKALVEAVRLTGVPLVRVLSSLHSRPADFEGELASALREHHRYFDQPSRRDYVTGALATELMGLAAAAYDRGIPFEVDSEYLPMPLVSGAAFAALDREASPSSLPPDAPAS